MMAHDEAAGAATTRLPDHVEVAVIGGGIAGVTAAYYLRLLPKRARDVWLFEAGHIAAGASGRAAGLIRHPHNEALVPLFQQSLQTYHAFQIPLARCGVMLLGEQGHIQRRALELSRYPDLIPAVHEPDQVLRDEPGLRRGPWAALLRTGYPVAPGPVTTAIGEMAELLGATCTQEPPPASGGTA
jgi:glycine/D-amino acid oxidase-like deaminating enzyme